MFRYIKSRWITWNECLKISIISMLSGKRRNWRGEQNPCVLTWKEPVTFSKLQTALISKPRSHLKDLSGGLNKQLIVVIELFLTFWIDFLPRLFSLIIRRQFFIVICSSKSHLKSHSLSDIFRKMHHGFQNLSVTSRNQTDSTKNLKNSQFGFDV